MRALTVVTVRQRRLRSASFAAFCAPSSRKSRTSRVRPSPGFILPCLWGAFCFLLHLPLARPSACMHISLGYACARTHANARIRHACTDTHTHTHTSCISSPRIRIYQPESLDEDLQMAAIEYLTANSPRNRLSRQNSQSGSLSLSLSLSSPHSQPPPPPPPPRLHSILPHSTRPPRAPHVTYKYRDVFCIRT